MFGFAALIENESFAKGHALGHAEGDAEGRAEEHKEIVETVTKNLMAREGLSRKEAEEKAEALCKR